MILVRTFGSVKCPCIQSYNKTVPRSQFCPSVVDVPCSLESLRLLRDSLRASSLRLCNTVICVYAGMPFYFLEYITFFQRSKVQT